MADQLCKTNDLTPYFKNMIVIETLRTKSATYSVKTPTATGEFDVLFGACTSDVTMSIKANATHDDIINTSSTLLNMKRMVDDRFEYAREHGKIDIFWPLSELYKTYGKKA